MIRLLSIFLFSIIAISFSFGQNSIDSSFIFVPAQKSGDTIGNIRIIQDPSIESLLHKKVVVNEARPAQYGYRVQIMSVTGAHSRDKVNMEKAKILSEYKDARVYIVYNAPYFKVRLGDFRTKLDAVHYLDIINDTYPQAFIVKDKVNIPFIDDDESFQGSAENIE